MHNYLKTIFKNVQYKEVVVLEQNDNFYIITSGLVNRYGIYH